MKGKKLLQGILGILFLFALLQGIRLLMAHFLPGMILCNPGSALGLPLPTFLIVLLSLGALFVLAVQWWKASAWKGEWLWLVLFGAGLSNVWERLSYGCVSDYLTLGFSFNAADALLTLGVVGLLWQWQAQNQKAKIKY